MQVHHDESLEYREILLGARARFVHSESMTIAEWQFEAQVDLPEHSHSNEQITKLLSGEFEITIDGEVIRLLSGASVVIPANAVHSGRSISDCHIIDVFHPAREDFKSYGQ